MRSSIVILSVFILFYSCNSLRKSISSSELNQEASVRNDILLTEDKRLSEITGRVSESVINELLSVDIVHKKYDTEKSVDKETKKYPVSEETILTIKKNKDMNVTDSTYQRVNSTSVIDFGDYSYTDTKMRVETIEEKESILKKYLKLSLMICGVFFVFIIFRIRRRKTLV